MILFFYGPNQYAAKAKLNETIARYKAKNGDIGLERVDGLVIDAGKLMQLLTTMPFLASSRLVVVEDLGQNKPAYEKIIKELANIPDTTNVIFYERSVDKRTSFFKTLSNLPAGGAKVAFFDELSPQQLVKWLQHQAQELGGSIDAQVAYYLVEQVGLDQWRLSQEIKKLINYKSIVGTKDIDEMVDTQFSGSVFDMIDALALGDTSKALKYYQGLRTMGDDPYKIMGMIGWQLHNILVAVAGKGLSAAEIAKQAGLAPFVVQKTRVSAASLGIKELRQMYKTLTDTDFALKRSGIDPDIAIEQLIVNLSRKQYLKVS